MTQRDEQTLFVFKRIPRSIIEEVKVNIVQVHWTILTKKNQSWDVSVIKKEKELYPQILMEPRNPPDRKYNAELSQSKCTSLRVIGKHWSAIGPIRWGCSRRPKPTKGSSALPSSKPNTSIFSYLLTDLLCLPFCSLNNKANSVFWISKWFSSLTNSSTKTSNLLFTSWTTFSCIFSMRLRNLCIIISCSTLLAESLCSAKIKSKEENFLWFCF